MGGGGTNENQRDHNAKSYRRGDRVRRCTLNLQLTRKHPAGTTPIRAQIRKEANANRITHRSNCSRQRSPHSWEEALRASSRISQDGMIGYLRLTQNGSKIEARRDDIVAIAYGLELAQRRPC